ncbi:MAG: hypothetical protein OXG69_07850 [bacterium]|nr:hypothetical protein [bacterium]
MILPPFPSGTTPEHVARALFNYRPAEPVHCPDPDDEYTTSQTRARPVTSPPAATRAPATEPPGPDAEDARPDAEDRRAHRRGLAAMWLGPGGAVAAMVAVSWYIVVRNGGDPPGGDMVGHAAAAEWFRTLPWWDWRGWSDWFYGGQAMGVNYPPLGHAWMRFTHPVYGQLAAVTVGLLVLLPWGALRLARAVGYRPREQRLAVGAVFTLAAVSGGMHWFLPGLQYATTFFGPWQAMLATTLGLFCAAWAARCQRPLACGVVAGVALLWNATVVPGVAVLCVALVVSSGASFRQGLRWAATAACSAAAVCSWWLVPFVAGWDRLVRWEVPLASSWTFGGLWKLGVITVLLAAAGWGARQAAAWTRRPAFAAVAVLAAVLAADLFAYLRPERWLAPALLTAAIAAAPVLAPGTTRPKARPVRPAWTLLAVASLVILVVITGRLELLAPAAWLLWWPRRAWAALGAVAWTAVLIFVPFWDPVPDEAIAERPPTPVEVVAAQSDRFAGGLIYEDRVYNTAVGDVVRCAWGQPWRTAAETGGRLRPLDGMYRETSHAAEFVTAEDSLRSGSFTSSRPNRAHWADAWSEAGKPPVSTPWAADALGSRWYAACTADGDVEVTELPGTVISGVSIRPQGDEDEWHRAAVRWWLPIAAGPAGSVDEYQRLAVPGTSSHEAARDVSPVPVLSTGEMGAHPMDRPATGLTLQSAGDVLTVRAERAGWAWLRVPWDPWWHSEGDTPVRKGGPGHLVVWAPQGETTLRWAVPRGVDVAAATVTGVALLGSAALAVLNRRRGFNLDPHRPRPAAQAVEMFADTVDGWAHSAARRARRAVRALAAPLRR